MQMVQSCIKGEEKGQKDGCSQSLTEAMGWMSCPALAQGPAPTPGWLQGLANTCVRHRAPFWMGTGTGQSHEGQWETTAWHGGITHVASHSSQGKEPQDTPAQPLLLAPHLADAAPSAGIFSVLPLEFYLQENNSQRGWMAPWGKPTAGSSRKG